MAKGWMHAETCALLVEADVQTELDGVARNRVIFVLYYELLLVCHNFVATAV